MKRIDRHIKCFQGMIAQDKLFFVPDDYNLICKFDLQQRKAGIEIWLDDDGISSGGSFFSVILSDDWLILIPGKSEQVIIFNMKTRALKRIDICNPQITTNEIYRNNDKFYGGFIRDNNVYILASTYPAILKINIDTEETEYIVDWIDKIRDRIPEGDTRGYFSNGFVLDDHYAYIPGSASGTIVRLDCNTDKTCVFNYNSAIKMLHGLITYKGEMWALATTDRGCSLIKWIPERGFLNEILIDADLLEEVYWWNPIKVEGYIYLFQSNGVVYKVNMQEEKAVPCIEVTEAIGVLPKINSKYMVRLIGVYKKKIIFLNGWTGKWFEFDTVKQKIDSFVIEIIDDEYDKKDWNTKNQMESNKPYTNEWKYPLTKYIKMIENIDHFEQNDKIQEGEAAKKIYEKCCKLPD